MVCTAFNADFDGDQMAVHVPLSFDAQLEARILMLVEPQHPLAGERRADRHADAGHGARLLLPDQVASGDEGEGMLFSARTRCIIAYNHGKVGLHATHQGAHRRRDGDDDRGTGHLQPDRPAGDRVRQRAVRTRSASSQIIADCFQKRRATARRRSSSTSSRISASATRRRAASSPSASTTWSSRGEGRDHRRGAEGGGRGSRASTSDGFITDGERYNKVIDIWTRTTNRVAERLFESLNARPRRIQLALHDGRSPARAVPRSRSASSPACAVSWPSRRRASPAASGEIIEIPIIANFREGLSILEYFISTHGARKGLADTALKTADAGYLTRRLVDVAQDVIITMHDCGTIMRGGHRRPEGRRRGHRAA